MPAYLSAAWMERANDLLSRAPGLAVDAGDEPLVIEQSISTPGGDICYHLRFDHAGAAMVEGPADDPVVVFALDYDTAAAIARGELSAQVAFQNGALQVSGDMRRLVAHRDRVSSSDGVLDPLRTDTTYATTDA